MNAFPTEMVGGLEYPRTSPGREIWDLCPFVYGEDQNHIRVFNRFNRHHYYLERYDLKGTGPVAITNEQLVAFRIDRFGPEPHGSFLRKNGAKDPVRLRLSKTDETHATLRDESGCTHQLALPTLWRVIAVTQEAVA